MYLLLQLKLMWLNIITFTNLHARPVFVGAEMLLIRQLTFEKNIYTHRFSI